MEAGRLLHPHAAVAGGVEHGLEGSSRTLHVGPGRDGPYVRDSFAAHRPHGTFQDLPRIGRRPHGGLIARVIERGGLASGAVSVSRIGSPTAGERDR